jgi:glycine dehydrogenase subunit 2
MAVLNANYVRAKLGGTYRVPYDELCKHEVVVQPPKGKKALDIAKGLIDHGYHPPTIYFPLVVKEAMLIEPTETESKETLDDFVGAMQELAETEDLEEAPTRAPTRRLDEARAARKLKARW